MSAARDPNTPLDALLDLLRDHAEEVLANPAFNLFALEAPDCWRALFDDFPASAEPLAHSPHVPAPFVAFCLRERVTGAVRDALLLNPSVSADHRLQLFTHDLVAPAQKWRWAEYLGEPLAALFTRAGTGAGWDDDAAADDLTEGELRQLSELGVLGLHTALRHPRCPPSIFERAFEAGFTAYHQRALRQDVARHPSVPLPLIERLAADGDSAARALIAQNAATPVAMLRKLATDPSDGVQAALVHNENIPLDLLKVLAQDGGRETRLSLARRELPDDIASLMVESELVAEIRCLLAANLRGSHAVMDLLASDEDAEVRRHLAMNPLLPHDLRDRLAQDSSAMVREAVAKKGAR